jgi:hypothetical protein
MVRAAGTLAALRALLAASGPGGEGHGLADIAVVATLRTDLLAPTERLLVSRAQQAVREFSTSALLAPRPSAGAAAPPTFTQNEEAKSRATSALQALHLLTAAGSKPGPSEKTLAIAALQEYLQAALKASLASLSRALAALPTLDRALLEVSARCQNVVTLQDLISTAAIPANESGEEDQATDAPATTFLDPLLAALDTASLPSFFWRSLASALAPRVTDVLARGGASARALRAGRDKVASAVRACVERGSRAPDTFGGRAAEGASSWEREATVMVAAVVGPLGR